jgi:cytochrome c oxidase subunit 2
MLLALLDGGGSGSDGWRWGFPENVSTHGGEIDRLFWIMTAVTVPFLLAVVVFEIYCLIRFRSREGSRPSYITGFRTAGGTAVLAGFLMLVELPLDWYQERAWTQATVKIPDEKRSLAVQVYAEQFAWNFRYAGADGRFGTADDLITINILRIPMGQPVVCTLRSRDVIHSFWLPNFRVKMDVVPGLTHRVWFEATREGTFEIACAELCGLGHYRMRGLIHALSPEKFRAWVEEMGAEVKEEGPPPEAAKWELWDRTR